MVKHISTATTVLLDPATAPAEIDRCLQAMLHESRPCYIGVPVDMSHLLCDASGLKAPLQRALLGNDPDAQKGLVAELRGLLEKKTSPIIIIDGNATRNDVVDEALKLSEITGFPTFQTSMGKGACIETAANYGGVYQGAGSDDPVKKAVESSDSVFWIGNFPSDFNTGEFTTNVATEVTVDFQRFFIKVGTKQYDLKMKYVLQALLKDLEATPLSRTSEAKVDWDPYPRNNPARGTVLTQDYLWPTLGKWFRPGDYAVAETGTSAFGIADAKLPKGASMFNQTIFGSIGFATGAAVGAFQAIKEQQGKYKQGVLVTGEGSMHLTIQAFMDMLKLELNPIVYVQFAGAVPRIHANCCARFVLNNDGYTIERLIHGKEASYNKLPYLDYSLLAKAFGPSYPSRYYGPIETAEQLDELFANDQFNNEKSFRLVELKLGYLDAPWAVKKAAAGVEEFNKRKAAGTSMGG